MLCPTVLSAALLAAQAAAPPTSPKSGAQVVKEQCALCHGPGIGGAPRIGDRPPWNKRLSSGLDGLVRSAIAGKGGMPPRGGLGDLSDAELRAAVAHMLHASGAAGGEDP
jgi:cytochrome c5